MTNKLNRSWSCRTISITVAFIFFLGTGLAWGEEAAGPPEAGHHEDIPAVPAKIMAALNKINQGQRSSPKASGLSVQDGDTVKVESGRNVNIAVAGDHLNRLVTPFENPVVHTTDKAKVTVDGPVVYVSLPRGDGPTAMFITENGEPDPSISLTLIPRSISPREIRLVLNNSGVVSISGKSAKWEKSQAYVEAIEKVMIRTARGEIPPGYNLRYPVSYDPRPRCRLPVRVDCMQVLEGHNFIVTISKMTNVSSEPFLVDESACYQEGVRAVGVWPQVRLSPQQSTELYVVYQRDFGKQPRIRPNVLHMATNLGKQAKKKTKAKKRRSRSQSAAGMELGLSDSDQNRP